MCVRVGERVRYREWASYLVCLLLCTRSDPLSLPAKSMKLNLPIVCGQIVEGRECVCVRERWRVSVCVRMYAWMKRIRERVEGSRWKREVASSIKQRNKYKNSIRNATEDSTTRQWRGRCVCTYVPSVEQQWLPCACPPRLAPAGLTLPSPSDRAASPVRTDKSIRILGYGY